ncbi:dienelactone hydrolase family protein [Micromonospora sp. B11E3]|uniref:dienelactone hydrolase family protein n=1 Tax=Micromonospora sp. B11E3 TaxID=3153562 RepID=UPI00325EC953
MCHPPSASPPKVPAELVPAPGGPGGGAVILTSGDGSTLRAYVAPAHSGDTGVVIAPDTRGLHPFYEELAERFADAGVHAIAFDYYGRTAGADPRPSDFVFQEHDAVNTGEEIYADLTTAIAHLRGVTDVRNLYLVGFCKGGRLAFHAAAERGDLSGVVGFYGTPAARRYNDGLGAPVDKVHRMRAPVLGLFGGADKGIPETTVEAFRTRLVDAGVSHCVHTYPGAPHSYFDRAFSEYRSECDDSWRRLLGFIRTADPTARL